MVSEGLQDGKMDPRGHRHKSQHEWKKTQIHRLSPRKQFLSLYPTHTRAILILYDILIYQKSKEMEFLVWIMLILLRIPVY